MAKPSPDDQRWYEAAQELTPRDSLERTQTLANFVFSNVAVVGTLLAGLGLVADKGAALRSAPTVGEVPLPVLLVGLSLTAASVAVWPKLSHLNPNRADEVKRWYTGQILRRGIAVVVALTALTAAIIVATLSFVAPALGDARISAAIEGTGEARTLHVEVEITGVSNDAVATASIDGVGGAAGPRRVFNATTSADASGAIRLEASLDGLDDSLAFLVSCMVHEDGEEVAHERLRIALP